MASTIAAITTGVGGVVTTADATGNLSLLSGATTIVAVTSTGAAVTGTLAATGTTNLGALTTTGNTILGDASTDTLNVGNGGLVKDASGNVGIGTSSPSKKLEVYATANSLQIESVVRNDQAGSGVAAIGFNVSSSAAAEATSTKAGIGLVRMNAYGVGSLCFYNNGTGSAGDFTTADERMRIDSSGNLLFNSGYGSVATAYGCRAWVNFNGTGTVAIRASGNVSSITDVGTGQYRVNMATAMPDANFTSMASAGKGTSTTVYLDQFTFRETPTTTTFLLCTITSVGAAQDVEYVTAAVFR